MKTKYLDAEIERLNLLERNDELSDWGKEMLIELKEIKQALLIQRVSNCGGAIPYDSLSDSFKKSIDSIEDNLNK